MLHKGGVEFFEPFEQQLDFVGNVMFVLELVFQAGSEIHGYGADLFDGAGIYHHQFFVIHHGGG